LSFVVVKYWLCLWKVGSWCQCHIIIIIAFPLDLIFVAAFEARCPLMQGNSLNDISILDSARCVPDYSYRRRMCLFLCRPVGVGNVFLESADVYHSMNCHICWQHSIDCISCSELNGSVRSCLQIL
jgi:hypothetical protein